MFNSLLLSTFLLFSTNINNGTFDRLECELITRLFNLTWEPNANKFLITKHGKENCARVIFNLKAKHTNKKENIIVQIKNSFGVTCHAIKFMTEVYTPNLYD